MGALSTAKKYFELSNTSDFEGISDLLTDQVIYDSQNTGSFVGRDAVIAMQKDFHAQFNSKQWTIRKLDQPNPSTVVVSYTFAGETLASEHRESSGVETITVNDKGKVVSIVIRNT